jgi:hypothetical protein
MAKWATPDLLAWAMAPPRSSKLTSSFRTDAGGVDRAPRAGAQDDAQLGNDPGGDRVPEEDVSVASQGEHALLDSRAAGVVQGDARGAVSQSQVLHLRDLGRHHFPERAPQHREVLGVAVRQPAVHLPETAHDSVAEKLLLFHAEIGAVVGHEAADFLERPGIEELLQSFRGRLFPFLVLRFDPLLPSPLGGLPTKLLEVFQLLFHRLRFHGGPSLMSSIDAKGV